MAALALVALLALAASAGADPTTKRYTATVTPTSGVAGSTVVLRFTIANSATSTQSLGSANITVPAGVTVTSVGSPTTTSGKTWSAALVDRVLQLRNPGPNSANRIDPGQSVSVSVTVRLPASAGTIVWTTAVKQSNDFSGSGNDFARTGTDPTVTVGAPTATSIVLAPATSSVAAGTARTYAVTGVDSNGNATGDLTASSTLTISPDGTCTGASCVATVIGPHTVTATNGSLTTTASLTVTAGAAASLGVSGAPSPIAGTAATVTVSALDAYGNVADGYRGTVVVNTSDAAASLPPAHTYTAADAGAHQFAITLRTAGSQSVTATDGTLSGSQTGVQVVAGPASRLGFATQPSTTIVGAAITPAVRVAILDAFGNVTTSTDTVSLALRTTTPGAVLGGTTSVAAVSGVATFADLTVSASGTDDALLASSAGVTGATSSDFDVPVILANCPGLTGCTGTTGDTTSAAKPTLADVTVPAGGKDGTLLIGIDPATTAPGFCGGGPCVGSIVTVLPPGSNDPRAFVRVVLTYAKAITGGSGVTGHPTYIDFGTGSTLVPDCRTSGRQVLPCVDHRNRTGIGDLVVATLIPFAIDPRIGLG